MSSTCISSTIFTGLNVGNKNIYINLLCFVLFFIQYQHSYLFLSQIAISRLYLKDSRIPSKWTNTMLFKWTCAHWIHVFLNYNLERCNIIYKHIVVIPKLWPPLHGTLSNTILLLHSISWTFTHQAGETWLGPRLGLGFAMY